MTASSPKGILAAISRRSDIYYAPLDNLHVRPDWNCRDLDFDPTDQDDADLARSIAAVGVKEALTVVFEDGKLFITNGHRRRAAALYARDVLKAEIKEVMVQAEPRYSSEADHVLSQIVRNAGKPLSSLEKGRVFKRLLDLGWTKLEVATKAGLSRQRVVDLLNLQAAPSAVTDLVKSGEVSATLASQEIRRAKGDGAKASARLTEGRIKAQAEGKTRVTARHLEARARPGLDERVEAILQDISALPAPLTPEALRPILMTHLGRIS